MVKSDDQSDPADFDPLATVAMWEDMHYLVKQWEEKHGATPKISSVAFEEFAAMLIVKRPEIWKV